MFVVSPSLLSHYESFSLSFEAWNFPMTPKSPTDEICWCLERKKKEHENERSPLSDTILYHHCSCCSHRLGTNDWALLRRPLQSSLPGENLRPLGQRLPVPTHAEAPSQRSQNNGADASKRRRSLGVHQVNDYELVFSVHPESFDINLHYKQSNTSFSICLDKRIKMFFILR